MGKKGKLQSVTNVLQEMLEKGNSPLASDFQRYRLKLDWAKVTGPMISEKCSPVGFSNGLLYIWVVNSTWMNQLFYVRKELVKKINDYVGKDWVREIRFTQNAKDVPTDAQWKEGPQDGREPKAPNEDEEPPRDR